MAQRIKDIAITITASEAEALILEHNLIKQLKPRYNVLMKDSKTYPYILLTDETYPKLQLYRGKRTRAGEYFGPFPHAGAVHTTLHIMQSIFQIRDCENGVFNNRSRPCMQHQIGRCSAPCCNMVSQTEYAAQVDEVRLFLKGSDNTLLKNWQSDMQQASDAFHFEQAAMLRDRIMALRSVLAGSEQSQLPDDADAITLIRHHSGVLACVGVRRAGRDMGNHNIRIDQAIDADDMEILQSLLIERYEKETPPAHIILLSSELNIHELKLLMKLIQPKTLTEIHAPKRGARLQWLQQVHRSGLQLMASRKQDNQVQAFEALARLLNLDATPERIAAVDNAHLGGKQMVSAITFANWQGPEKELYRRYKLDGLAGSITEGDDYAAMHDVLNRFFRAICDESLPCPDLMLIDGGRGQLAIAIQCATDAGLHDLKLLAVSKGDSRKLGEETLWPGWFDQNSISDTPPGMAIGSPLQPGRHDPALLLIARVRDEAHRFAGAYMRKRKKQSMFSSALDGIDGIDGNEGNDGMEGMEGIENPD